MNQIPPCGLLLKQLARIKTQAHRPELFALLLLLTPLIFSAPAHAQTAQWIKQQGNGGISNGVSSDAAGNAYATGTISNPGLFENITIPCHASDVFVAKYDPDGAFL